ncbi:MAG: adenine deaminase [Clostridia bacterium]|nr:adenine deaminase [Clostridia bacterium]
MKRTLIQNAQVYNSWLRRFLPGWLLIEDGRVRYAFCEEACPLSADITIDAKGCYCIPSFLDIHLHVESSMVVPSTFSRELLRHGVTTCVAEPHEIANVFGIEGVNAFIKAARDVKADILWGIPSSVPCTEFETTGGRIELDDALELLRDPSVHCLGEVMNCWSVLNEPDGKTRQWLRALRRGYPDLTREGHIPYYFGTELCDIAYHGVDSDHTGVGLEYFIERMKLGVFGEIQNKSLLPEVVEWIEQNDVWDNFCLVTDDTMPDQLYLEGHLDRLVRKAVALGMKPERAIQAVTLNPAGRMKLYDRGMIAPGKRADLMLVEDIRDFKIQKVFKDGEIVFDSDHPDPDAKPERRFPESFYHSVRLAPLNEEDFTIRAALKNGEHIARMMRPNAATGRVEEALEPVLVQNGKVDFDETEYCVIAVFDRYTGSGRRMLGLTAGTDFLKRGAVACTYAHDHHNLLVAGKTKADCAAAANWVIEHQGGYCAVENGRVVASLPLEVGGIVTEAPLKDLAKNAANISAALVRLGYRFPNPIMSFSVLGLTVSPALRITDCGYVDVRGGRLLPLFDEEEKEATDRA